ncbi:LON peptidase substrate-binding domain-containing protein [Saccharopolyspora erythraea]|uniref:LON peptidase substrate-binding domain-containing protein n=1 Tax=Saccharopolyspora erythraea TaxID=1836 RepID=UPI00038D58CC|nr:LON peptidase substrate-binding domain-containing protein [Saccharopolyspora erythraea]EQD88153.1 peptidase [Saccharopolyspora erythraea D]QRK93882.1 LON peptidase substrate-binding domain-containing protein [Saccharopolyspora erythraea]
MDTLPLFPLSTVLLPGASLPLHVFEPRYRQLTMDLLNEVVPDRRFGVVAIRQGWEVGEDNVDSMYDVGCSAVLRDVRQLPEGRYDITASGEQRFRLLQIDREAAPYLMARVQWLPDVEPKKDSEDLRDRLAASARSAHERYHGTGLRGDSYEAPDDGTAVDELSYALAEDCVLSTEDRQALLAETDPLARLRLVRRLMLREAEFLRELRAVPAPLAEFAAHTSVN